MKATQRFIFVNKNNYKQQLTTQNTTQVVSSQSTTQNMIMREVIDSFRQTIGNYWFPRLPNGKPAALSDSEVNPKATLAWHERKELPFTIRLGKTHTFSTFKNIPTSFSMTTLTLVADDVFGPFPSCAPCWYRYLYGFDMLDPSKIIDSVYGFTPLKIQEIESKFTINDPTLAANPVQQQKVSFLTPLSMLLLTDAGLPTTERLGSIGIDISYLSYGEMLIRSIARLSTDINASIGAVQIEIPAIMNYSAKLYKDSVFESDIATLTDVEQSIESEIDFSINATTEFVHNYTAREYEDGIEADKPGLGLNLPGGETKLVNMYEAILNKLVEPTILKLRGEMDCFKQNLVLFFRPKNYPYDSKIIYTLAETLPLVNKFYPFETLLPYHSKINFTLQPTGPIGAAIEETRNDGMLMRHLQESEPIRTTGSSGGSKVFKQTVGSKRRSRKITSLLIQENNNVVKTWGFYEWMLKLGERLNNIGGLFPAAPTSIETIPNDSIILNNGTKSALATAGIRTPLGNYNISLAAVHAKVGEIIKFNSRSYPELLRGDRPYKEVIAYKIEKYANISTQATSFGQINPINMNEALTSSVFDSLYGNNGILTGNPSPLQEMWFFNSSKEEIVKYVDTQIKNNTFYTYVVYAYLVVLESEYYYTNVSNPRVSCERRVMDFTDEVVPVEQQIELSEKPLFVSPTESGPARPVEVPPIEEPIKTGKPGTVTGVTAKLTNLSTAQDTGNRILGDSNVEPPPIIR